MRRVLQFNELLQVAKLFRGIGLLLDVLDQQTLFRFGVIDRFGVLSHHEAGKSNPDSDMPDSDADD